MRILDELFVFCRALTAAAHWPYINNISFTTRSSTSNPQAVWSTKQMWLGLWKIFFFFFLFSLDLQDLGSFIFSEGEMRAALLLFQHMYLWLAIAVHIKKQQEADDCVWCRKSSSTHEVLWFNEAQVPPARSFLGKHPRMWKIGHMYREHVTTPATKSYIQIMFFFPITNPMPFAMCLCHFV